MDNNNLKYIKTVNLTQSQLNENLSESLNFNGMAPAFIMGYLSPHLNFQNISQKIKSLFPSSTKVILLTTAGELCSFNIDEKRGDALQ